LAGVSPMTVSRVVRGSGPVSDDVRQRVEQAVAQTGYMPNVLARSLRSKRTNLIALLVTDMTNPFFTTLAHGVEAAANDAGMMVILGNSNEDEGEEDRYVTMLLQRQIDGILIVPAGSGEGVIQKCRDQGTPLVVVDRRISRGGVDVVRTDSRRGAYEMGRLVASLGHVRTAVLTGPRSVSTAMDRAAGFRDAMREAGRARTVRVVHGEFSIESGDEMARSVMSRPGRPTAIFAGNNFVAIGVLHALQDMGIRVPEDVSVVGFDDLPSAMVTFPFLTVVAQPVFEMGRRAVDLLVDRIEHPGRHRARDVVFPTELVIRKSSATVAQQLVSKAVPVTSST
jgi:LacI family transcriptional regulator